MALTGRNSKSWVFRYMIDGKAVEMGIGSYDDVGLQQARELTRQYRARCTASSNTAVQSIRCTNGKPRRSQRSGAAHLEGQEDDV